jgi:hypothetical protein
MTILGRGLTGIPLDTGSIIVGVGGQVEELPVGALNQVLTVTAGSVVIEHFDALVEQLLRRNKFEATDWVVSVTAFCVAIVALVVGMQPGVRGGWGVLVGIVCGLIAALVLRPKVTK